jgi:Protein of unknown function (DUF1566)
MKKNILTTLVFFGLVSVSQAQSKPPQHTVGEKWGGGVVFVVVADGRHGLIADTKDQKDNWGGDDLFYWILAKNLILHPGSLEGANHHDWRLPERSELNLLYHQKNIVGGFVSNGNYWCSTETEYNYEAWYQNFGSGQKIPTAFSPSPRCRVRAIRTF